MYNHDVSVHGDHATAELYGAAGHILPSDDSSLMSMEAVIRYEDEYRRVDGQWLIHKRRVHADWMSTRPVQVGDPLPTDRRTAVDS